MEAITRKESLINLSKCGKLAELLAEIKFLKIIRKEIEGEQLEQHIIQNGSRDLIMKTLGEGRKWNTWMN